jgi:NAD/NADP transhydrogenase alpha subunit
VAYWLMQIPPGKVLVIGAGVAGLSAIATVWSIRLVLSASCDGRFFRQEG